jgi:hypothetical protein
MSTVYGIPIVLTRARRTSEVRIGANRVTYRKPTRSSSSTRVSAARRALLGTRMARSDAITAR